MARHIRRPCLPSCLPARPPACPPVDVVVEEEQEVNCFMRCWGGGRVYAFPVRISALSLDGSGDATSVSFAMSRTKYHVPTYQFANDKPPAVIHIAAALSSAVSRATQGVTLPVVASYIAMKTVRAGARRGMGRAHSPESRGQESSLGTEQRIPTGEK
ncbi:hypothetical protein LX32DRAFT_657787 [Colletotrichum zoysiae]|uniref:Uncharacterized protein n=1 Tax=Colletotrichum zoysiae TaxID=1216348 RepID=A0AAD9LY20_9PEZI|nr:hypothetical protein LX32DRAFT_657787 [Colletotrichum zoysiae]